jgi:hypothetical protein
MILNFFTFLFIYIHTNTNSVIHCYCFRTMASSFAVTFVDSENSVEKVISDGEFDQSLKMIQDIMNFSDAVVDSDNTSEFSPEELGDLLRGNRILEGLTIRTAGPTKNYLNVLLNQLKGHPTLRAIIFETIPLTMEHYLSIASLLINSNVLNTISIHHCPNLLTKEAMMMLKGAIDLTPRKIWVGIYDCGIQLDALNVFGIQLNTINRNNLFSCEVVDQNDFDLIMRRCLVSRQ